MRKVILGILGLLFLASCTEELGTQKLPLGYDDSINFQTGLSASDIRSLCKSEQDKFQKSQDAVAALTSDQANFKTAVLALENATTLFSNNVTIPNFLKYVSPDAKVREAAGECETEVSQYFVDIYTREDLFKAIKAASQKREKLDPQSKQLLEETLSRFTRNGLDLPADKRKIYIEKKKELVKAEFDYSTNLDEYEDELVVTKEQLEGLSDSYIQGLKKTAEGKYRVTMAYPDYYPKLPGATPGGRVLEPMPFDARTLGRWFGALRPPLPEFLLFGGMMPPGRLAGGQQRTAISGMAESLREFGAALSEVAPGEPSLSNCSATYLTRMPLRRQRCS
jgi:hypothetical protein